MGKTETDGSPLRQRRISGSSPFTAPINIKQENYQEEEEYHEDTRGEDFEDIEKYQKQLPRRRKGKKFRTTVPSAIHRRLYAYLGLVNSEDEIYIEDNAHHPTPQHLISENPYSLKRSRDSVSKHDPQKKKKVFHEYYHKNQVSNNQSSDILDDLTILKGILECPYVDSHDPKKNLPELHEYIKDSLHVKFSEDELAERTRKLENSFYWYVDRKGKNARFRVPIKGEIFELSKRIWRQSSDDKEKPEELDKGKKSAVERQREGSMKELEALRRMIKMEESDKKMRTWHADRMVMEKMDERRKKPRAYGLDFTWKSNMEELEEKVRLCKEEGLMLMQDVRKRNQRKQRLEEVARVRNRITTELFGDAAAQHSSTEED
ncbi:GLABROUS1 enhancer-binding protein family [Dillenia turbinata]|uniref:GLABROUS1 enhancer-binding protein family n=1 Tax=Dillenia turbinata TaxID=194707 RepID=A0AAN8ZHP5_9MAGN